MDNDRDITFDIVIGHKYDFDPLYHKAENFRTN
jgi:hypothetical protein